MVVKVFALIAGFNLAHAQDTMSFVVVASKDQCRRADSSKPYDCKFVSAMKIPIEVTLEKVATETLDDETFFGQSEEFGVSASSEQFITKVSVKKSILFSGKSTIYEIELRSHKLTSGPPNEFKSVVSAPAANLKVTRLPFIPIERYEPNERYFTQTTISAELKP